MAVPTKRSDLLDRTMANLLIIESIAKNGTLPSNQTEAFETTQLVNSFLVTLIQHWDALEKEWHRIPQNDIPWPRISTNPNEHPRQYIGKIRDALAHGLFFVDGENGKITSMRFWTCPPRSRVVDWDVELTVLQMRQILVCIIIIAKKQDLPFPSPKKKGDANA
jgi:hypothetical protein